MKRIRDALVQLGADAAEIASLAGHPSDVSDFWCTCADPVLMMRVAAAVRIDAFLSVAVACDTAGAVLHYIGKEETRPRAAVMAARNWMQKKITTAECLIASEAAEVAADSYRDARKNAAQNTRRAYRAAAYAAYAAANTARTALAASIVSDLQYDQDYTFEDAWDGACFSCANHASEVLHDVVEAAVSATAARIARKTGSDIAGRAAAHEARPEALRWAADLVRKRIETSVVVEAANKLPSRTPSG